MDHAEQARTMADAVSKCSRSHTSEDADMITDALLAAVHAQLETAPAIREQTAEIKAMVADA